MGPSQFDTKGEKILTDTQKAIGQYLINMFSLYQMDLNMKKMDL